MNLILVGTGALAYDVINTFCNLRNRKIHIDVIGSDAKRVAGICYFGNILATTHGTAVRLIQAKIEKDYGTSVQRIIQSKQIDGIICCSSKFSASLYRQKDSAWSRLIKKVGFGVSIPLQYGVISEIAYIAKKEKYSGVVINCCFPDAVNFILQSVGLGVHTGVGNIGSISKCLNFHFPTTEAENFRILANHSHFSERGADLPKVWCGSQQITDVNAAIGNFQKHYSNYFNRFVAIDLLNIFENLEGELKIHLAGPNGLLGGYPAIVTKQQIVLDLPQSETMEQAIAFNERTMERDGVVFDKSCIVTERWKTEFERLGISLPNKLHFEELNDWGKKFQMYQLRLS